ncbi:MAG: hypothetical protein IJ542_01900 [Clostridia bacterium]|nr:hypothetical protein [Clostridia bacterium]
MPTSKIIEYCLYGVVALIVILCIVLVSVKSAKRKKIREEQKTREVDGVVEKHGVRYSEDATIVDKEGNPTVSLVQNDIVLQPRKMVTVSTHGPLKPGKWTVLSAYGNEETFNIRIGLYVKEYKHGQEIILAEGDEICPTSTTIILR